MTKFWVNVRDAKRDFPHDATCTAVYGTLQDAENYAYDYMCNHWGGCLNHVTIMDENQNIIEEYDV
jgi:hypothetical protein